MTNTGGEAVSGSGEPTQIAAADESRKPEEKSVQSKARFRDRLIHWIGSLKPDLWRASTVSVLLVVLVLNLLVTFDWFHQLVPQYRWAQLGFHRLLCVFTPRLITPKWVRTVEIDDQTHAQLGEPTNREFLAKLISNAARGDAAVIVLDVKLLALPGFGPGQDDEKRKDQNAKLLDAVLTASDNGVPVALSCWLRESNDSYFERLPNVILDSNLPLWASRTECSRSLIAESKTNDSESESTLYRAPACVYLGNLNLPLDRRQIPLVTPTKDSDPCSNSLALAAVSAYEDITDRKPRTWEKEVVAHAIAHDEFPFASFIPESSFQKIPIQDLANGTAEALKLCRGRIIIIGGKWHGDTGHGALVDTHSTPAGQLAGMYVHANYIEALLDDRYQSEVPLWFALMFDLVVGAWLYVQFHRAQTRGARLQILLIPAFLLFATYVIFTNLNFYLDFILAFSIYFVHLGVEYLRDYRRLTRSSEVQRHSQSGSA